MNDKEEMKEFDGIDDYTNDKESINPSEDGKDIFAILFDFADELITALANGKISTELSMRKFFEAYIEERVKHEKE